MHPTKIEITHKTIIFIIVLLISLWFVFIIRDVLLALFIAIIIMSALNPLVEILERKMIPRAFAILFIFILILLAISGIIAAIIPPFVIQTRSLLEQIPKIMETYGVHAIDQRVISDQLGSLPGNFAKFVVSTFSNLIAVFTVLVLSFYLLAERKNLHSNLMGFFGSEKAENAVEQFINNIEQQIGSWVRGELALMLIIGLMSYLGLTLLNVSYALPLSIIAGLLEIIPGIGPTISLIPAVLIALATSPVTALATAALYILIQQIENNFIVPKVMQKAVGVKPLVTILAIMIGIELAGGLGAVLAVPSVLVIRILIEQIASSGKFQEPRNFDR